VANILSHPASQNAVKSNGSSVLTERNQQHPPTPLHEAV
jgi:hypothetical protein